MSHLQFNCNKAVWQAASFIWDMMYFGFCYRVRFRIPVWREHNPPLLKACLFFLGFGEAKEARRSLHNPSKLSMTFYRNANHLLFFYRNIQYIKLNVYSGQQFPFWKQCFLQFFFKKNAKWIIKSFIFFQLSFTMYPKIYDENSIQGLNCGRGTDYHSKHISWVWTYWELSLNPWL